MKNNLNKIISAVSAACMAVTAFSVPDVADASAQPVIYIEDFENASLGDISGKDFSFASVALDNTLNSSSETHSNAVSVVGDDNKYLAWELDMPVAKANTAVGLRFNFDQPIDPADGVLNIGFSVKYDADTATYPGCANYAFRGGMLGNDSSGGKAGWDTFQPIGMTGYVGHGGICNPSTVKEVITDTQLRADWYDVRFIFDGTTGKSSMKYRLSSQDVWTTITEDYVVATNSKYAPYTFFSFVMGNNASGKGGKAKYYLDNIMVNQGTPDGIFISPDGNDTNSSAIESPYASIEKGLRAYELCSNKPTLYLMGGEHKIDNTINISERYSGVCISAYNDEPVEISAGYTDGSTRLANTDDCQGKLSSDAIGKIIRWDVSGYENLIDDATASNPDYYNPELVDGLAIKTIARWPDNDWAYTGEVTKNISDVEYEFCTTAALADMTLDNAKMRGFQAWNYRLTKSDITGLGEADNSLLVKVDAIIDSEYSFHSNRRYYLYNIPEEINTPGEYYVDYEEKAVYYYPENTTTSLRLTGLRDGMFVVSEGADNVSFYGITFRDCRGTAIKVTDADNFLLDSCVIKNIGGRGVFADGTNNTEIKRSHFTDIGDSSVEIVNCGDRPTLTESNNSINNCFFENGARISGTYAPFIQLGESGELNMGCDVVNNYFRNHMHSAIIFEGNNYNISKNIFDNIVHSTQDCGAIYSRANPTYLGNVISNNIFRNITTFCPDEKFADVFGVYLDDLLGFTRVENNVFYNCLSAANFGGGSGNKFNGNLIYDCYEAFSYKKRGNINYDAKKTYTDDNGKVLKGYLWAHYENIKKECNDDLGAWFEAYPEFELFVNDIEAYNTDENVASSYTLNDDAINIKYVECDSNVCIANEADNEDFYTVYSYDSESKYGVPVTNMYRSTDFSKASINGTQVSLNVSGYTAPMVTDAGIIDEASVYSFASGTEDNGEGFVHPIKYMRGYRYESFDGYANDSDISVAGELDISGSGTINADGKCLVKDGACVVVKSPLELKDTFAFSIYQKGNVTITLGDFELSTGTCADYTLCELIYDGDKIKLYKHTAKGNYQLYQTVEADDIDEISSIVITAEDDTLIDAIGVSSYGNNTDIVEMYADMDFEDCSSNVPLEEYSSDWLLYDAYGNTSAIIKKLSDGTNEVHVVIDPYSKASRNNYVELLLPDIKMTDNIINIEFTYKSDVAFMRFIEFAQVCGYLPDNPDEEYSHSFLLFDRDGNLKTTWDDTVATFDEVQEGVGVRMRYDKNAQAVSVYKNVGNGWETVRADRVFKTEYPHYMTKLRFHMYMDKNLDLESKEYILDDVRIYSSDCTKLFNGSTEVTDLKNCANAEVTLSPEYITGSGIHTMCAALYDGSGKMIEFKFTDYLPGASISFTVPSDANEKAYYIKRFMFTDMNSISPVMKSLKY